jgi:hypothetical protein
MILLGEGLGPFPAPIRFCLRWAAECARTAPHAAMAKAAVRLTLFPVPYPLYITAEPEPGTYLN